MARAKRSAARTTKYTNFSFPISTYFPQALQDRGGWLNEEVIDWFAEYAKVVAENFSDICEYFITLNEPQCFVGIGHLSGVHAPGKKLPYKDVFQIAHNALRAHGKAVINLRKYACRPIKVGYAPTCGMAYPATDKPEDIEAARKTLFGFHQPMDNWTWNVAWFNDPVFLGKYPEEGLKKFAEYLPEITDEDMKLISQPLDFMGQNIYTKGACYHAKYGAYEADKDCVFVSEASIPFDIGVSVGDVGGRNKFYPIAVGGREWYNMNGKVTLFLDDTNRVEMIYRDKISKEHVKEIIEIHGLPKRPPKTTKLSLEIELYDGKTGAIIIRDVGFGKIYPTTNKIYRKEFSIG